MNTENKNLTMNVTCHIDRICQEQNISVYAMAKSIGMHPNQMYTYTSGRYMPNLMTALLIAQTLNTSVDNLWTVTMTPAKK